jgi:predicted DNA-binding transcriptional regulator AlpA
MKTNVEVGQEQSLLTIQRVAQQTGLNIRTIQRWSATGEHNFPKPIKLGRLLRWRSKEIQSWIAGGVNEASK